MTDIVHLGARRASLPGGPENINPRDMLLRVIEQIDSGTLSPSHVIVVSATTDPEGKTQSQIDHAGSYDRFGQYGMLADALQMLRGS